MERSFDEIEKKLEIIGYRLGSNEDMRIFIEMLSIKLSAEQKNIVIKEIGRVAKTSGVNARMWVVPKEFNADFDIQTWYRDKFKKQRMLNFIKEIFKAT